MWYKNNREEAWKTCRVLSVDMINEIRASDLDMMSSV